MQSPVVTAWHEEAAHVYWQAHLLAADGPSTDADLSAVRRALSGRPLGQELQVCRALPLHGLRPTHLSREPARHRSLPARPRRQALPHGHPGRRVAQHPGRCQRTTRLAHLRRLRPTPHPHGPPPLCGRRLGPGTRRDRPMPSTPQPSICVSRCSLGPTSARPRRRSSCTHFSTCAAPSRPSSTSPPASSTTSTSWTC